jgi:hypothetical protein
MKSDIYKALSQAIAKYTRSAFYGTALAIYFLTCRQSYTVVRIVGYYTYHFSVWTNGKKKNISHFFATGWNRRALYPLICKLRLWDWGQKKKSVADSHSLCSYRSRLFSSVSVTCSRIEEKLPFIHTVHILYFSVQIIEIRVLIEMGPIQY